MSNKTFLRVSAIYLLSVLLVILVSLFMNYGHFVYVLDDPYIHMTIAKNFVTLRHWATNGAEFSSATSSPLWTLIISAVYLFSGVNVITPFVLNVLSGILVIYVCYFIFRKYKIEKYLFLFLLLIVFVSPLPALVFTGMEHIAQIAFTLLFVYFAGQVISGSNKAGEAIFMFVIAPLLTGLRYECMFLVLVVSVLLIIRKKVVLGLVVLIFGLLPIIIYGYISSSQGWFFFPNTILVKSKIPELSLIEIPRITFRFIKNTIEPPMVFLFCGGLYLFYYRLRKLKESWTDKQIILLIFLLTTIFHMSFAQTGWFFRYEAYLVALGIMAVSINVYEFIPKILQYKSSHTSFFYRSIKPVLIVLISLGFTLRALTAFLVPQSSNNIYNQHYQMGMFVKEHLYGVKIAANDIGMINYYSDNVITDLWGLANKEIAKEKLAGKYSTEKISEIVKQNDVRLAMVYQHWFDHYGGLPKEWIKIGEWTITDLNIVCGAVTVDFYSINKEDSEKFKSLLNEYSTRLPNSVTTKNY